MYDSGISKVFNNRTEYYSDPNYYYLKRVALKKSIRVMICCIRKAETFSFLKE